MLILWQRKYFLWKRWLPASKYYKRSSFSIVCMTTAFSYIIWWKKIPFFKGGKLALSKNPWYLVIACQHKILSVDAARLWYVFPTTHFSFEQKCEYKWAGKAARYLIKKIELNLKKRKLNYSISSHENILHCWYMRKYSTSSLFFVRSGVWRAETSLLCVCARVKLSHWDSRSRAWNLFWATS